MGKNDASARAVNLVWGVLFWPSKFGQITGTTSLRDLNCLVIKVHFTVQFSSLR